MKYIVVCVYSRYNDNWRLYNPKYGFNWVIDNDVASDVLYEEDNHFNCLRIKICI